MDRESGHFPLAGLGDSEGVVDHGRIGQPHLGDDFPAIRVDKLPARDPIEPPASNNRSGINRARAR